MSDPHPLIPRAGTLERVVLEKLVEMGDAGVTVLDFAPEFGIDEEKLLRLIENLRHGMYESDGDKTVKFDD